MKKFNINVDFESGEVESLLEPIILSSGDYNSALFVFCIKAQESSFDVSNYDFELVMLDIDNKSYIQSSNTKEGKNTVSFKLKNKIIENSGVKFAELRVKKEETVINTLKFSFNVQRAIYNNGTLVNKNEEIPIVKLEKDIRVLESDIKNNEMTRKDNEMTRKDNEMTRENNEILRNSFKEFDINGNYKEKEKVLFDNSTYLCIEDSKGEYPDNSSKFKIISKRGLSAYEIAKKNGFEGTEEEWLDSLKASSSGEESVNPSDKLYIVKIDENILDSSEAVSYEGDCKDFTPVERVGGDLDGTVYLNSWEDFIDNQLGIKPCIHSPNEILYLNKEDYNFYADGSLVDYSEIEEDSRKNVMVEFPSKIYYRLNKSNDGVVEVALSTKRFMGSVAFAFDVKEGYNLLHFYGYSLIQMLFVLLFKSLNHKVLGSGLINSSSISKTGTTLSRGLFAGDVNTFKFLGLEDIVGNSDCYIEGINKSSEFGVAISMDDFENNNSNVSIFETDSQVNIFLKSVVGNNELCFLPDSPVSGSSNTHYSSLFSTRHSTSDFLYNLIVGGNFDSGEDAGLFYQIFRNRDGSTFLARDASSRLMYIKDNKLYIGAFLSSVDSNDTLRSLPDKNVFRASRISNHRSRLPSKI